MVKFRVLDLVCTENENQVPVPCISLSIYCLVYLIRLLGIYIYILLNIYLLNLFKLNLDSFFLFYKKTLTQSMALRGHLFIKNNYFLSIRITFTSRTLKQT